MGAGGFIDRVKVKGLMYSKRISAEKISAEMGISHQSFYNRMRGKVPFDENDITVLVKHLGREIFLYPTEVSN